MSKVVKLGLDEAGRGCVLGSLFLSIVSIDSESTENYLKEKGVRDSKVLSKGKREDLYEIIKKHTYYKVSQITPKEIDNANINDLELQEMVDLINETIAKYESVNFDGIEYEVYIDCPISDNNKHKKQILSRLHHTEGVKIITENKADDKYVVVGAASIMAKTLRDESIKIMGEIHDEKYGDIGSGYPSDSKTTDFLKRFYESESEFPEGTREKWGTIERIRSDFDEINKE
jgi:ribonuclease HII